MTTDHYDPERIRQTMELAGLTQQALADRAGVHRVTVARALAGKQVSYDMLSHICRALGVDVVRILHPRGTRAA